MTKIRVSTLLSEETLKLVQQEAKEKSITVSAIIRQKVEAMIKFKQEMSVHLIDYDRIDSNGDVFLKGCFEKSIEKHFNESKTTLKSHKPKS